MRMLPLLAVLLLWTTPVPGPTPGAAAGPFRHAAGRARSGGTGVANAGTPPHSTLGTAVRPRQHQP